MRFSANDRLGAYQIRRALGKGGMGEVYHATDPRLERDVAIKVLPAHLAENPDALRRFEREAKALAALSHPNILTVYDVGKQEDMAFVVMELLKGQTLREQLVHSSLAWKKSLEISKQIAEGLSAAHARGIIHRDLKPENIFLTAAERGFKRAIELNPNYAYAHQCYAELLYNTGRFEEALAQARIALELDPLSRIVNSVVVRVLYYARRYDDAIAQFKRNIDFEPNWPQNHRYLYEAFVAKGLYVEAVEEFGVLQKLCGESFSEIQATKQSFVKSGWKGFLKHRLEYLEAKSKKEYVPAYDLAILYSRLGDKEKAFALLEKAYQEREYGMSALNTEWFDNLRSDQRFQDFRRRVGL
ncbi:protein kinase [bacterium]|nr:protein kinase [bacterium]